MTLGPKSMSPVLLCVPCPPAKSPPSMWIHGPTMIFCFRRASGVLARLVIPMKLLRFPCRNTSNQPAMPYAATDILS